jgi:hypothetical protein
MVRKIGGLILIALLLLIVTAGASSNLFTYSEKLNETAWTKIYLGKFMNDTLESPTTAVTGDSFNATTGMDNHYIRRAYTVTAGTNYTYGAYFKKNGVNNFVQLTKSGTIFGTEQGVNVNISSCEITRIWPNSTAAAVADGDWCRVSESSQAVVSGSANFMYFLTGQNGTADRGPSYQGSDYLSESLGIWGMQLVLGDSLGTYVATTDTAIEEAPGEPATNFTSNITANMVPTRAIAFTEVLTNLTPTERVWIAKDYSTNPEPRWECPSTCTAQPKANFTFSTSENPTHTFGAGNWSIFLSIKSGGVWYNKTDAYWANISAGSTGGLRASGTEQIMPANSIWYRSNLSDLPKHANSNTWIAQVIEDVQSVSLDPYAKAIYKGGHYYFLVNSSTPKQKLINTYYTSSLANYYDFGYNTTSGIMEGFPIPDDAMTMQAGTDHVLEIYDETNHIEYTINNARKQYNGTWWGSPGIFNMSDTGYRASKFANGTDNGRRWLGNKWYNQTTSLTERYEKIPTYYPNMANLPTVPLLVRYEEVAEGFVNHTIYLGVLYTNGTPIWPAQGDGGNYATHPTSPPAGAIVFLDEDYDISGFGAQSKPILQAWKTYGGVLVAQGCSHGFCPQLANNSVEWDDDDLVDIQSIDINTDNFWFGDTSSLMVDRYSMEIPYESGEEPAEESIILLIIYYFRMFFYMVGVNLI